MEISVSHSTIEERCEGYALSAQQERVQKRACKGEPGRVSARCLISGPLDNKALQDSLTELVASHEILRTHYRRVMGEHSAILMIIAAPYSVELCAEADGDDGQRFEARLYRKCEYEHLLVLSLPRLSSDQDSLRLLMELVVEAYDRRAGGCGVRAQESTPEQILQYVDFAQWQSEQAFAAADGRAAVQTQASQTDALLLPLERAGTSGEILTRPFRLDVTTWNRLQELGVRTGDSIPGMLLACWSMSLWRVTERPDSLAIRLKTSYRPFAELKKSIGIFDLYAPCDISLSKDQRLAELANICVAAYETRASTIDPRSVVADALWGSQGAKIGFSHAKEASVVAKDGTVWCHKAACLAGDQFVLELCVEENDGLSLEIRYDSGKIAQEGVLAIERALTATIQALIVDPEQKVGSYRLLSADAERELIKRTNPAPCAQKRGCWHLAFRERVDSAPDSIALRWHTQTMTYRELDERANQFARFLRMRGCQARAPIVTMMNRSDRLLVAILAIHKLGAIYLPIDMEMPAARLEEILRQTRPQIILTVDPVEHLDDVTTPVVSISALQAEIESHEKGSFGAEVSPDDPAYILFTSGSTGKPKGVIVSHGALFDYAQGIIERASLRPDLSYLSVTPFNTDLGHTTIFPPLIIGGQVNLAPHAKMENTQELIEYMSVTEFDVLKITPSHFSALLALAAEPTKIMPLKTLIFGGEILSWGLYRIVRSLSGSLEIFNHYGPTETCVGVISQQVTSDEDADLASTVPLGLPLKNARVYVLDEDGCLLPQGAVGELYIGGSTVADTYVEPPSGARSAFLADPWIDGRLGGRMYKSGDKVRLLPSGKIEYLGRTDRQMKVCGYRVEPGEIEACLREHEEVLDARVVERGDSSSSKLFAYVIHKDRRSGVADWLKEHLRNLLPMFMIPAQILSIPHFPLAASGKIDDRMLPDPASLGHKHYSCVVKPRTDSERKVAKIFQELLIIDSVSAKDDFFDVGGHSLLATKLAAQLRKEFDIPFSLRNVFSDSTVEGLAMAIDAELAGKEP